MIKRLALSGQFLAGKDFVAKQANFKQLSFAEPMYRMCEYFFGHCDKKREDIRHFLQTVGQWGWGYDHPEECPCTPERALFVNLIRRHGREITGMNGPWEAFGKVQDFWVSVLLCNIAILSGEERLAITNIRFPHEEKPIKGAGFEHYLVACSEWTRVERNQKPIPEELLNDISERYATELFQTLPDDKIIWNDHRSMPNGRSFLTVGQFLELCR